MDQNLNQGNKQKKKNKKKRTERIIHVAQKGVKPKL